MFKCAVRVVVHKLNVHAPVQLQSGLYLINFSDNCYIKTLLPSLYLNWWFTIITLHCTVLTEVIWSQKKKHLHFTFIRST